MYTHCIVIEMNLIQSEDYKSVHKGIPGTFSHKIYLKNSDGVPISPFHDIPYKVKDGGKYLKFELLLIFLLLYYIISIQFWLNCLY